MRIVICSCGAKVEPDARFCGNCGATMPDNEPTVLPRSLHTDPDLLRQAEAGVAREEEKARGGDFPPPWTPPPELRPFSSPATVYGTPQMMGMAAPPPPPPPSAPPSPPVWGGPQGARPAASPNWGVPPAPAAWASASPPAPSPPAPPAPAGWAPAPVPAPTPPAPVYGGPPAWAPPSAPPGDGVPVRILAIPALGTLCGVGLGFALGHDLVPALIGGAVAAAAAIWHASRLR